MCNQIFFSAAGLLGIINLHRLVKISHSLIIVGGHPHTSKICSCFMINGVQNFSCNTGMATETYMISSLLARDIERDLFTFLLAYMHFQLSLTLSSLIYCFP